MDFKETDWNKGQVLLVDKPLTWTSFDVVKKLRYTLKIKKIGHAGTLDPLATGLLVLCTGKMTKQIDKYQAQEKEYTGKLVLGKTTPSHDLETEVNSETPIDHLTEEQVRESVQQFIGPIEQIPPMHSAIKVNGQRVYKKARKGEEVILEPRKVTVSAFELTDISLPEVSFRIVCSKGTYIRSLVRDLGESLGVGAYMSELRRTRIGEFRVEDAENLEEFVKSYQAFREENESSSRD
ncbi:MAG: tRNA pseudouridine(55) synthase TruB [Cytophagales bacterium]|nr:tRNA pseudouridine(55) synthase TruB [Cytophagales bacterium]